MALKLVVDSLKPLAQVVAHGRLDDDSARVLRLKTQSLMATGHRTVVIDLCDVDVEESGIAVLGYARRIYRIAGGSLALVGLSEPAGARLEELEAAERFAEVHRCQESDTPGRTPG